ncbi:uncharacterized protein B0H64DRAFT_395168 [Chaetomium fimeti]|uniref:Uncharacterized protein n=1 Tax=Chaetomium fimeti TaxID=1854472 RepID=A0AAE0HFC8_9PEZI|nr:hypothetical protein B0H64DRAFT_395168 [Chaetomium fimeti]
MTAQWNPEKLLSIRGRPMYCDGGIQCHGANHGTGPRCRWTKGGRPEEKSDVTNAEIILRKMATNPPSSVTSEQLRSLAKLCLCRDHHMTQMQVERVVRGWDVIVQLAVAAYTPPRAAPVPATPAPIKAPTPTLTPFASAQFDTTQWQTMNWQTTLAGPAAGFGVANISTQSSQSTTNGAQHQHADAPSGFTTRNSAAARTPEQELAAVQEQLAALRLENTELREKERRLETLTAEYSTARQRREEERASTQTELSTLQGENNRLRQEQQRLEKLDAEYSAFRESTEAELAATQEKVLGLQSQSSELAESQQEQLEHLKSEHSEFLSQLENELEAVKEELSQADADKQHLKASLTQELTALQQEHEAALAQKDAALTIALHDATASLQTLREEHTALQATHATTTTSLHEATTRFHETTTSLQTLHKTHHALEQTHRELSVSLHQRDLALQARDTALQQQTITLQEQTTTLQEQTATLHQQTTELQHARADNARLLYALKLAEARSMSIPQPPYLGGRAGSGSWVKRVRGWVKRLGPA